MGPSAPPTPAKPAHTATAFGRSWNGKQFMTIERVAGMMNAAPMPITARAAISWLGSLAKLAMTAAPPNTTSPNCERALATEAITERARRQQHAGEHEGVGVDEPLQLRAAGAEARSGSSAGRRSAS